MHLVTVIASKGEEDVAADVLMVAGGLSRVCVRTENAGQAVKDPVTRQKLSISKETPK